MRRKEERGATNPSNGPFDWLDDLADSSIGAMSLGDISILGPKNHVADGWSTKDAKVSDLELRHALKHILQGLFGALLCAARTSRTMA